MNATTRYLKRTRLFTEEEAQSHKYDLIEAARFRLSEAIQEFRDAVESPLKMSAEYKESVEPRHPEYENASICFSPSLYIGDWKMEVSRKLE